MRYVSCALHCAALKSSSANLGALGLSALFRDYPTNNGLDAHGSRSVRATLFAPSGEPLFSAVQLNQDGGPVMLAESGT